MNARSDRQVTAATQTPTRAVPSSSSVVNIVVRVAGMVPVRLDLTHAKTVEQQLGLSLGTVLVYLRSGITARAVAEGWGQASALAQPLSPAVVGRRVLPVGPSVAAAMVQLAGVPKVTTSFAPARAGGTVPAILRVQVGPVTWEVCDATAYACLLRGWRQAARLLGDNPTDDE